MEVTTGELKILDDARLSRVEKPDQEPVEKLIGILSLQKHSVEILRRVLKEAYNSIDGIAYAMSINEIQEKLSEAAAYELLLEEYLETCIHSEPRDNSKRQYFGYKAPDDESFAKSVFITPDDMIGQFEDIPLEHSDEQDIFESKLIKNLQNSIRDFKPLLEKCPGDCSMDVCPQKQPTFSTRTYYENGAIAEVTIGGRTKIDGVHKLYSPSGRVLFHGLWKRGVLTFVYECSTHKYKDMV